MNAVVDFARSSAKQLNNVVDFTRSPAKQLNNVVDFARSPAKQLNNVVDFARSPTKQMRPSLMLCHQKTGDSKSSPSMAKRICFSGENDVTIGNR